MKWIVIGRILMVIGVIPYALMGATLLDRLADNRPITIYWEQLVIGIILFSIGFYIESIGKKHRAKKGSL